MTRSTVQDHRTLEELRDRAAIADLVTELASWLDNKRWDDADTIFTEEATADTPGGVAEGRASVVAQAAGHQDRTQHQITNVAIQLDGDSASVHASLSSRSPTPTARRARCS